MSSQREKDLKAARLAWGPGHRFEYDAFADGAAYGRQDPQYRAAYEAGRRDQARHVLEMCQSTTSRLRPGWRQLPELYAGKPQYSCRLDDDAGAAGVVFWDDRNEPNSWVVMGEEGEQIYLELDDAMRRGELIAYLHEQARLDENSTFTKPREVDVVLGFCRDKTAHADLHPTILKRRGGDA